MLLRQDLERRRREVDGHRAGEPRGASQHGQPRVVGGHDLEAARALGQVRRRGVDGRREPDLVDAAAEPGAAREVLARDHRRRASGTGREPHLDAREAGAPVACDHHERRRPADHLDRRLERDRRRQRLGARHEQRDRDGEQRDEEEPSHQPSVRTTASRFRVMRWVAPQMMCSPTG